MKDWENSFDNINELLRQQLEIITALWIIPTNY